MISSQVRRPCRRPTVAMLASGGLLVAGCSSGISTPLNDGTTNGGVSLVLGESVLNSDPNPPPTTNPGPAGDAGGVGDGGQTPTNTTDDGSSGGGWFPGDPNVMPPDPGASITPDLTTFTSRSGPVSFNGLGIPTNGENSMSAGISPDGFEGLVDSRTAVNLNVAGYSWRDAAGLVAYAPASAGSLFNSVRAASATGKFTVGNGQGAGGYQALRWDNNNPPTALGQLSATTPYSEATAISANGLTVAGVAASGTGFVAFRWTIETGMTGLGDLPGGELHSVATGISADGTVIVGYGDTDAGELAFRWAAGQGMIALGTLPGGDTSRANATNGDGSVVVGLSRSSEGQQGFRWTSAGGMEALGDLPGGDFYSAANAVSADGSVVVGTSTSDQGFEAIIWDSTHGMRRVTDALMDNGLEVRSWTLKSATGISADGKTIVGYGINPNGDQEAWIAHLP